MRAQARVFVDGKLRASAAVGAPAGRATGRLYPAARPVVGGRADLGPNDFFGGLLANVSLRVESLPPTEAEVPLPLNLAPNPHPNPNPDPSPNPNPNSNPNPNPNPDPQP